MMVAGMCGSRIAMRVGYGQPIGSRWSVAKAARAPAPLVLERPVVDFWKDLIKPHPKQVQFLKASLVWRYLLFGGARGPGKSHILRWGLVWRLIRWAQQGLKQVRVALVSEDYPT